MRAYLSSGVFAPPERAMVYIERATPHRPSAAASSWRWTWSATSGPPRRAPSSARPREPSRRESRPGWKSAAARLEAPHILLLIDDDERRLVERPRRAGEEAGPAFTPRTSCSVRAPRPAGPYPETTTSNLAAELERLAGKARTRYGTGSAAADPFLFAVGDGNHSLATAKAVWDEYKRVHAGDAGLLNHPARWALVEVENIYDEGIV